MNECWCKLCGKQCCSIAQLHGHLARAHSHRNIIRRFISGVVCPCCLLCLCTRERLLYHLKKCGTCAWIVKSLCPIMPLSEAVKLDSDSRNEQRKNLKAGFQPRFADKTALTACGPRHWVVVMASRLRIGSSGGPAALLVQRGRDVLEVPEIQYLISSYAPAHNLTAASLFLAGMAF